MGNFTDEPAVLLGHTGRTVLNEGESDLVEPLDVGIDEVFASGKRHQKFLR
jgi:hypothetical protein